jgi:hypothetical protein
MSTTNQGRRGTSAVCWVVTDCTNIFVLRLISNKTCLDHYSLCSVCLLCHAQDLPSAGALEDVAQDRRQIGRIALPPPEWKQQRSRHDYRRRRWPAASDFICIHGQYPAPGLRPQRLLYQSNIPDPVPQRGRLPVGHGPI